MAEKEIEYLKKLKEEFEADSEFKTFLDNNKDLIKYLKYITESIVKSIEEIEDKYLLQIYVISRLLSNRSSNFLKNRNQFFQNPNSDGTNNDANNSDYIRASSRTKIQNPKLKEHIKEHIRNNLNKYKALIKSNAKLKEAFKSNFNYDLKQKLNYQFKELHSRWNDKFNTSISSLKTHSLSCLFIAEKVFSLRNQLNFEGSSDIGSRAEFKFEKIKSNAFVVLIDLSGSIKKENLEKIKEELTKSLKKLKTDEPNAKVALISFDSGGYYYGGGKVKKKTIKIDDFVKKNKTELDEIIADAQKLDSIKNSYPNLIEKIGKLFVGGGSCISSPLAHSIVLASAFENSQVIILTDGVVDSPKDNYVKSMDEYFKEFGVCKIKINSNHNLDFLKNLCNVEFNEISDLNKLFEDFKKETSSEPNGLDSQTSINNHDNGDVNLKEMFQDLDIDEEFTKKCADDLEDLFSFKEFYCQNKPDYRMNKIRLCSYVLVLRSIDIFERAVQLSNIFKLLLADVNENNHESAQKPNFDGTLLESISNVYEYLSRNEKIRIDSNNLNKMFEDVVDEINKVATSNEDDYAIGKLFECVSIELFQKSLELSEQLDNI